MALDGLADTSIRRVELHSTNYTVVSLGDSDHDHPFRIVTDAVIDDLAALKDTSVTIRRILHGATYCKVRVSLKNFHWSSLGLVEDIPVIYSCVCHQT